MNEPLKEHSIPEHRQYIRLDSVLPVQFKILNTDGKSPLSEWLQGFTNNISKGGICLTVNNLKPELAALIKNRQVKISLDIEMPLAGNPIAALAKAAWVRDSAGHPDKYLIGLSYEEIAPKGNEKIMRYARAKKLFVPFALSIILLMGLILAVNSYMNLKLIKGNKALVNQLISTVQEANLAKQTAKEITTEKEILNSRMLNLQARIKTIEEEKMASQEKVKLEEEAKVEEKAKLEEFNMLIQELSREKASLQEQLTSVQNKENVVAQELSALDKKKATLEKANFDKMYQWLSTHQNTPTGLVMSFEGDGEIANLGFTYDQALIIAANILFSDFERARKTLDFLDKKAKRIDGRFLNAYYVTDGLPAEYTVHSGPNIWLGIAILHYTDKSKDNTYLKLAEEIGESIIALQGQSKDGGIRGGPDAEWYATEHNLDAYAFFNMLYKITGKQLYLIARDKVLNWLVRNTYNKSDIPIMRGKGDSTIATDTYAWSIAAVGPEKLKDIGMDPDSIVEFAEKNCGAEVYYARPEGQSVKIKGFDFAPQKHVARGGVVSSEWTAQMVMAFKIMAGYYYKKNMAEKADGYLQKANEYLAELTKMIISSPSPSGQGASCLPYATQDSVDTGHGWMTPKGKSTGSVAGTAYAMFAYYNYNPLELKE